MLLDAVKTPDRTVDCLLRGSCAGMHHTSGQPSGIPFLHEMISLEPVLLRLLTNSMVAVRKPPCTILWQGTHKKHVDSQARRGLISLRGCCARYLLRACMLIVLAAQAGTQLCLVLLVPLVLRLLPIRLLLPRDGSFHLG